MYRKLAVGLVALGSATAGVAGPAGADPKGEVIPVTCNDGTTYNLAVNGNGEFTPGHDVDSNTVLIPVAFGTLTGTVRNPAGQVVGTFTESGAEKGRSGKNAQPVTCSFSFTFTNTDDPDDTEVPLGHTFTGAGTVIARVVNG